MKLLELCPFKNPDGLLAKMWKELLTSKTAWSSDRCKMTWKKKVSKSNVVLFQLQASVLGIKERESGLLHTPTATANQGAPSMFKRDQGSWGNHMYPTPSASCQMDVVAPPDTVNQNSKGWSVTRLKTGTKFGAKLNDVVNKLQHEGMYPTPTTQDSRIGPNNIKGSQHRKERGNPALADKVLFPMYPTPTPTCEEGGEQSYRTERTKSGGFITRRVNKPHMTYGAKLSDAMLYLERKKMYPTPRTGAGSRPNGKGGKVLEEEVMIDAGLRERGKTLKQMYPKVGGRLNPQFVQFLMGYPINWTKIE